MARDGVSFSGVCSKRGESSALPSIPRSTTLLTRRPGNELVRHLSLPMVIRGRVGPVRLVRAPTKRRMFSLKRRVAKVFGFRMGRPMKARVLVRANRILRSKGFCGKGLEATGSRCRCVSSKARGRVIPRFACCNCECIGIDNIAGLSYSSFATLILYDSCRGAKHLRAKRRLIGRLVSGMR